MRQTSSQGHWGIVSTVKDLPLVGPSEALQGWQFHATTLNFTIWPPAQPSDRRVTRTCSHVSRPFDKTDHICTFVTNSSNRKDVQFPIAQYCVMRRISLLSIGLNTQAITYDTRPFSAYGNKWEEHWGGYKAPQQLLALWQFLPLDFVMKSFAFFYWKVTFLFSYTRPNTSHCACCSS